MWKIKERIDRISQTTIIEPDGFSGWTLEAKPTGYGGIEIEVNGIVVADKDNGGKLDYNFVKKDVRWNDTIKIICRNPSKQSATFDVVLKRYYYTEEK